MTDYILVQTSTNSEEAAQKIADVVIQSRLAACCWISVAQSISWWKGTIEKEQEWVLQFKTRADLYDELEKAIKAVHTYQIPEIVATPITAGSRSFLDFVEGETKK
jgi:periplasmic divalent cation tolerance protein